MKTKPCALCGKPYVVRTSNSRYCGFPCRFGSKVDRTPQPPKGCNLWTAFVDSGGYGKINVDGKMEFAHRVAWELKKKDPIPDGQCVLHECDNRRCVNPDHLFTGTKADNVRDMVEKKRQARGETIVGHKLTEDDVLRIRRGYYADMTQKETAKKLGVSCNTIYKVLRGVTWKHSPLDSPISLTIMGL